MRRKEKHITAQKELDDIIHGCQICRLAMAMDNVPYMVPLSYGYDGRYLYFHSAPEGRKIEHLKSNPRVCFQMERAIELITAESGPCHWTFHFESVVGQGIAVELTDGTEKKYGLDRIVAHYGGTSGGYPDAALAALSVWRITIENVTGKRSPAVRKPQE